MFHPVAPTKPAPKAQSQWERPEIASIIYSGTSHLRHYERRELHARTHKRRALHATWGYLESQDVWKLFMYGLLFTLLLYYLYDFIRFSLSLFL
jgi:hypothetical protein